MMQFSIFNSDHFFAAFTRKKSDQTNIYILFLD